MRVRVHCLTCLHRTVLAATTHADILILTGQIPLGFSEIKSSVIDFVFDDDPAVNGKERVLSIKVDSESEKMYLSSDNDDDFGLWFSGLNNVAQT